MRKENAMLLLVFVILPKAIVLHVGIQEKVCLTVIGDKKEKVEILLAAPGLVSESREIFISPGEKRRVCLTVKALWPGKREAEVLIKKNGNTESHKITVEAVGFFVDWLLLAKIILALTAAVLLISLSARIAKLQALR